MDDNPILFRRLQKHRQYRQIIDAYEQSKSPSYVARAFMLTEQEAALVCGIIDTLKEER
ncbi:MULTISPECIES: hypothetical protein [unclassified Pantoea]|uniref:hypothetical protein n=1 Tax=unclassified Pantoea TaxID=2630326 RepID=UPI00168142CA|nr:MULTISPECIES: hypothetical protein [unclassified Pantoea]